MISPWAFWSSYILSPSEGLVTGGGGGGGTTGQPIGLLLILTKAA